MTSLKEMKGKSKSEQLRLLKLEQLRREQRRRVQVGIAEEAGKRRMSAIGETTEDVATVIPQAFMMGGADEAIGLVNEEWGEQYRQAVAKARERSLVSTLAAEVITPTPLGYLGKLSKLSNAGKLVGKAADKLDGILPVGTAKKTVVESALTGAGEAGEDNRLSGAVIGGGLGAGGALLGKAAKWAVSEPAATRARKLGVTGKSIKKQVPDLDDPQKYIQASMDNLKATGLFMGKGGKFNVNTGRIEGMDKVGRLDFPDHKELQRRLKDIRTGSAKEVDRIIAKKSDEFALDPDASAGTYDIRGYMENNEDKIIDIVDDLHNRWPHKTEEINKMLNKEFSVLTKEGSEFFNISDLHTRKKHIYEDIANTYAKNSGRVPDYKKSVLQSIARLYKESVEDIAPEVIPYNKAMKAVYDIQEGVGTKARKAITDSGGAGGVGGRDIGVAIKAMGELGDPTSLHRAAIGDTAQRLEKANPAAMETLRRGATKLLPQGATRDMRREPQSIEEDLMRIRFPRDTQYILDNRDAFLEKVKVMEPEAFETIHSMIEYGDRADAEVVLPQLTKKYPHLFEPDSLGLNMFDGKVPQESKAKAAEYIFSQNMSNTEKISRIDKLNRTGAME